MRWSPPGDAPQAAQAPLVALEGSSTIVFGDTGGARKAVVAVKPISAARPKEDEEPSVIEFSLGDLRNPAPGESLKARWRRARDPMSAPEALEFEFASTVRRPGLYTAYIAPLPLSNPAERLRIQIDMKPAKLALSQKLVVARTIYFWTSSLQPKLEVREADGFTSVPMLTVSRVSAFSGLLPIAAGLKPDSQPIALPAGQTADVKYTIDRGVPLGTVTGALRFSATELTEPVLLDYELRTKLSAALFIPVVVSLGFFIGWLVRKRLVDIANLGEARERAKALLSKVDKSLAELPDADFQSAVKPRRDELDKARWSKKTDAIVTATTDLDTALREALADFNRRKVAATENLATLQELAGPPLPLPQITDERLASARAAAVQVDEALTHNNVSEAKRILKTQQSLAADVRKLALNWQDKIAQIIKDLKQASTGLPAPVQTDFAEKANAVTFDRIKPQSEFNTPELQRSLFIDFYSEARDVRVLLTELSTRLGVEWNLVAKTLEPIRSKLESEYGLLDQKIDSFQRRLELAVDDPASFAANLSTWLQELDEHWSATLMSKVPNNNRDALKPLLEARQYLQLAKQLVPVLGGGTLLGAGAPEPASTSVPWPTTWVERLQPAFLGRRRAHPIESPDPIDVLSPEQARGLQSLILAVIYIAVYWMLNADGFGNSLADVAILFITSFGLDLSAEGIFKLKK